MTLTTIATTISLAIPAALLAVAAVVSHKATTGREKLSPYECGFDPKKSARLPFSLRFFLLAVVFLIFDIEIILLFPLPMLINAPLTASTSIGLMAFIAILLLGLLHEWNEGTLNWAE